MATKKTKSTKVKVGKLQVKTTKVKARDMKKVKGGAGYLKIEGVDGEFTNSTKRGT